MERSLNDTDGDMLSVRRLGVAILCKKVKEIKCRLILSAFLTDRTL